MQLQLQRPACGCAPGELHLYLFTPGELHLYLFAVQRNIASLPYHRPWLQVMREFGFLVRVCTAREATNFGIFLNEVFALVERWRVSWRQHCQHCKRTAAVAACRCSAAAERPFCRCGLLLRTARCALPHSY